jgi:hypothetical protein
MFTQLGRHGRVLVVVDQPASIVPRLHHPAAQPSQVRT